VEKLRQVGRKKGEGEQGERERRKRDLGRKEREREVMLGVRYP
jgi:hypothetical protein